MSRYRVCFDGRWQHCFADEADALEWARLVADTGRLVHVVRMGIFWSKLVAVFPEDRAEEGKWVWKARMAGSWTGDSISR